jgi:hypothetical protein
VVVLTAYFSPVRTARGPRPRAPATLTRGGRARRAAAVLLLLVALVAGFTGPNSATLTVAPAVLVGAGWPILILGSLLLGRSDRGTWQREAEDRDRAADSASPEPLSVHPAALTALFVVWYLVVQPDRLRPRVVAAFLTTYLIINLVGYLVAGRCSWLRRGEVIGLLLGWFGRMRGGRLIDWTPPAGASMVLGILAGGFIFGLWRSADPWLWIVQRHPAAGVATFVVAVGGAAVVLGLGQRRATRRGDGGLVVAASVPLVGGLALAHAVERGFLITVQLIPRALQDPLGRGWRLFDLEQVNALPLAVDPMATILLKMVLVIAGGVTGAVVLRARASRSRVGGAARGISRAVGPAMATVCVLLATAVLAVANQSARTWG